MCSVPNSICISAVNLLYIVTENVILPRQRAKHVEKLHCRFIIPRHERDSDLGIIDLNCRSLTNILTTTGQGIAVRKTIESNYVLEAVKINDNKAQFQREITIHIQKGERQAHTGPHCSYAASHQYNRPQADTMSTRNTPDPQKYPCMHNKQLHTHKV